MRALPPPWALRLYTALATLVAVVLLIFAVPRWNSAWRSYPYDGKTDWIAARAWLEHKNPYSDAALAAVKLDSLGHPPSTSFYMLPFAHLSMEETSPIIGQLTLMLLFMTILLSVQALDLPAPLPTTLLVFALTASSSFMRYNLAVAQISSLIISFLCLGWVALRRGHEVIAGLLFGYACTLKLYPGLLVLGLLWGRRFRGVAAACAIWLVVAAVMTSRFGLVSWKQFFVREPLMVQMWMGHLHNASLYAVLLRALRPICMSRALPIPLLDKLVPLLSLGLVALCLRSARGAWRSLVGIDLAFASMLVLAVFLNPFTFEHYFSAEVIPLLIALPTLAALWRLGPRLRGALPATLVYGLVVTCMALPMGWKDDAYRLGRAGHGRMHLLEYANWVHLPLCFFLLLALGRWERRRRERTGTATNGRSEPAPAKGAIDVLEPSEAT
jgi:hypothetical protein